MKKYLKQKAVSQITGKRTARKFTKNLKDKLNGHFADWVASGLKLGEWERLRFPERFAPQKKNEIPLKQWKLEESERIGISFRAVECRVSRGSISVPNRREVNSRVIFVRMPH